MSALLLMRSLIRGIGAAVRDRPPDQLFTSEAEHDDFEIPQGQQTSPGATEIFIQSVGIQKRSLTDHGYTRAEIQGLVTGNTQAC